MSLSIQSYSVAFCSDVFILFLSLALHTKHHVVLFCFYPWPYILNTLTPSRNCADVFHTIHVFSNLFSKISYLFGQILIMCLKCSRASFLPSSYKRCVGDEVVALLHIVTYIKENIITKLKKYTA